MIARCNVDGKIFVPRSATPRCPRCHGANVRVFTLEELEELLTSSMSSGPASREPGPAPDSAAPHDGGVGDRRGDHPRGGLLPPPTGEVTAGPNELRDRARADGPEDLEPQPKAGRRADEKGSNLPPQPAARRSFSDADPGIDVRPIRREFWTKGWDARPRTEQLLLLRDAMKARGLDVQDVERLDELRESIVAEGRP